MNSEVTIKDIRGDTAVLGSQLRAHMELIRRKHRPRDGKYRGARWP